MRFEGRFRGGERHGKGRLYLPNGTCVDGCWRDGCLAGRVRMTDDEGRVTLGGLSDDGDIEGDDVVEEYADGRTRFKGSYKLSARDGKGHEWLPDGAQFVGDFKDDAFHGGPDNVYIYPDGVTRLVGTWSEGTMQEARLERREEGGAAGEGTTTTAAAPSAAGATESMALYSFDPGTLSSPGGAPLLPDPYETSVVAVGPSGLGAHAGEGLFARCPLPADRVVAYYSGLRLPREVVDVRTWKENENCIALDPRAGTAKDRDSTHYDEDEDESIAPGPPPRDDDEDDDDDDDDECPLLIPAGTDDAKDNAPKEGPESTDNANEDEEDDDDDEDEDEKDDDDDEDEEDAEEIVIDIPPELASTSKYCATLGHKVNHANGSDPRCNTEFDFCQHPRFGEIRCLRTRRAIQPGEELLCDYGYGKGVRKGPIWFQQLQEESGNATDAKRQRRS